VLRKKTSDEKWKHKLKFFANQNYVDQRKENIYYNFSMEKKYAYVSQG